jgi:A/G-specific adenine glycosylase
MLQQTQVDRVVPIYGSFLEAFPSVGDCAQAGSADVVRLWSGLGYNRRALNLHRAAVAVVAHGGVFPHDDRALRALPGVGSYTARAFQSFAFGLDVAAVDTNVVRVLARCVQGSPLTAAAAQALADRLVPAGQSWEFNQSMFDLGATVCTGSRPACLRCPLRQQCRWRKSGMSEPDPWRASPSVRTQSRFAGSNRQGRGRLLTTLRAGPVDRDALARACGWPDDEPRAKRIAEALVAEGFAEWTPEAAPVLRLR